MKKKSTHQANLLDISAEREITVGQLAESVTRSAGIRCTPGMINNYEKLGLIRHSSRTEGGIRRFRVKDIQIVGCIKRWQAEGTSLVKIKERLDSDSEALLPAEPMPYLPEDKRTLILEASARVFPRKGYEATTMQDIATEANISPSMIYQFYRSKEDLFLSFTENTAYNQIMESMTASLDKNKQFAYEDIRQALFDVASNFVSWHVERIELIRLLVSTSRSFPGIGKHYQEKLISPTEQLLTQFFERLTVQGQVPVANPKWASKIFFSIFADMALSWNWFSGNAKPVFPSKSEILAAIDIYLTGIFGTVHNK